MEKNDVENHDEILSMKIEIQSLATQIEKLTSQIEKLTVTCGRMDNHIDFVDGVYETVRAPANYVWDKVGFGTNLLSQKAIEQKAIEQKAIEQKAIEEENEKKM